ncbi:T9SS sorting signal type C domain-containing protein [Flavobacterium sp. UGB4466]|uniref:T9SS sorting signal type C domain-containing protein n=1 Tax=Flavobacterium sp. UGB4466 TaxID=2730889 RepID=UPI001ED9457D|nr:T9SS sorting signal type C domain-containing protein [Flavobacterium sp. UGB4466]
MGREFLQSDKKSCTLSLNQTLCRYLIGVQLRSSTANDCVNGIGFNKVVFLKGEKLKIQNHSKQGGYSFSIDRETFNERFVLSDIEETLASNSFSEENPDVFISVEDRIIKVISTQDIITQITVFDILGKPLYRKENIENLEFQLPKFNSYHQVLIVKIKFGDGKIMTRKILL